MAKAKDEDDDKKKKARVIPKSLADLKNGICKEYGDGAIMQGDTIVQVDVFPTGVATIDRALGTGGFPQGRIMEIFGHESSGKTTVCLQIIAACQEHYFNNKERYGVAAFIDAEHAFDRDWAAKNGVKTEDLLFSQPNSGEEAFDIAERMAESGLVDLIVIDSVAALVPMAERDGDVTDSNIGMQARLLSKGLRKLTPKAAVSKTSVVLINQVRQKIGVMFGCLHGDTIVDFADGRSIPIAKVVDERIEGEVWSYATDLGVFVPKPITNWHHNGEVESSADYLSVAIKGPGTKNGRMHLTLTPDHEVMTDDGWLPAKELVVGDKLLTKQEAFVLANGQPNGTLGQFLTGVLSGDSHIGHHPGRLAASVMIRDNTDPEYMKWKVEKLGGFLDFALRVCPSGERYESSHHSEFLQVKSEYPNRDPMLLLNHFSWLGFAVWIMDDAVYERGRYQLSIKRFAGDFEKIDQISRALDDLGLYHYASKGGSITFDKAVSDHIANHIYPAVPPCMQRKLPASLREYKDFTLQRRSPWCNAYATVVETREASARQMKNRGKYDITVAGTQCYSAGGTGNGVIVHNSPDTTPGGLALKFWASIRAQIFKGQAIVENKETMGFSPKIKFIKNKCARPFTEAEFDICVGHPDRPVWGIDRVASLIEVAKDMGIITLKGSNYSLGDQRLGAGIAKAAAAIRNNPEIEAELKEKIYGSFREKLALAKPVASDDEGDDPLDDDILDQIVESDE